MKIPAIVGGAVGLATAVAAVGVAHERRQVNRERARIDPSHAAAFGVLSVDRESWVHTEDGVDLHVEEVGPTNAPLTVLFVHGFTLNLNSFHFQRLALREAFGDQIRMVFYDHRSHGRSDRAPSAACTLEQLGLDLLSVIEQVVPAGPLVLIGHSMGGMTIMSLADQRPDLFRNSGSSSSPQQQRVVAVLLTNTSAGELREVTLGLPAALARLRGPVLPVVLRRAAKNVALVEKTRALGKDLAWVLTKHLSFATDDVDPAVVAFTTTMIAATPVDVVSHFYSALMSHDGRLGLMNLTECSVLVFGAEQDALTPLRHAEAIAAALPAAQLIRVPNAGHMLMLEHPDVVNKPLVQLVDAALRDTVGRRSARHRAAR